MSTATLSKSGTLIQARGREWVVLPDSTDDLLMARPVGGLDEEVTGILPAVESVASATFRLPTAADLGDFSAGQLLRDAARLSTRAAAGPFRSFGRIAVEPRPYQLVPLMMALKLDPVRLLIADDVGIGKTIEAGVVARELLDRGEIRRLAVLCPPHLAEQWQRELSEKFHLDAELVLSSTIQRLERDLPLGVSVFDRHRCTIVSTDFIKSARRAEDFVFKCPECIIVDEAHGCTLAGGVGRGRQQRFDLLRRVAADTTRHLVLVTATPHSGNEEAFRSLLSLLDPDFANLPIDLERAEREGIRRRLARHLVQRRRADIRHYLETDTAFPARQDKEATYTFSQEYRALFDDILAFARDYVSADDGVQCRRRVRYWSALALLRCVSSSPAAAAATLRSRAAVDQADDDEVDEIGRRTVLDQGDDDDTVALDFSPGSSEQIAEALFEGALFKEQTQAHPQQMALAFLDDLEATTQALHAEWDNARDREKASRSRFAQHTLSPDAVAAELENVRQAIGRSEDVARFFSAVLQAATVPVQAVGQVVTVHLSPETPRALRQAIGRDEPFTGRFDLPLHEGEVYLGRTSPVIEGVARWTLDQALDPVARDTRPVAARCGVVATAAVSTRTTLLVVRCRFHLHLAGPDAETILCEEIVPLACTGPAAAPQWLTPISTFETPPNSLVSR